AGRRLDPGGHRANWGSGQEGIPSGRGTPQPIVSLVQPEGDSLSNSKNEHFCPGTRTTEEMDGHLGRRPADHSSRLSQQAWLRQTQGGRKCPFIELASESGSSCTRLTLEEALAIMLKLGDTWSTVRHRLGQVAR